MKTPRPRSRLATLPFASHLGWEVSQATFTDAGRRQQRQSRSAERVAPGGVAKAELRTFHE
jgi:hypothetical protein